MAFVYSCCFWFSLRLGGILIGLFSLVKALIVLVACGMAHANPEKVKEEIIMWTNDLILIYTKGYMDNLTAMVELVRLVILSMLVVTGLLVLKKNTMDIGLLIGASVASGFLLCSNHRETAPGSRGEQIQDVPSRLGRHTLSQKHADKPGANIHGSPEEEE
ncbi:hypothetical protein MSG28_003446 [Choristoneura fumiferana]|uniref:Uncharacterized protein n=1 Tax=Choristoneura fumiferana TaxID=7141 RepID=A0ACC0KFA6_CHOFU|nr:hypothetical protein MSG28_003446 [Choristoneura fumiferana]